MIEGNDLQTPTWLRDDAPDDSFPPLERALREPNGLLAVGGDLSVSRLLHAYKSGIFPWYSDGQPILWWSPHPRAIIIPAALRISRRLQRTLRRAPFEITTNTAFEAVVEACSMPRPGRPETWITPAMKAAYTNLHTVGAARSVECWQDGRLAGGIYGVSIGRVFFGESMFTWVRDASKIAMVHLCKLGYELIDCQIPNPHLTSLGATLIPRDEFSAMLGNLCDAEFIESHTQ